MLPHEKIPTFLSALTFQSSATGTPPRVNTTLQKAYEIIACRVPLVAAAVGSMKALLTDYPRCLYEPGDPANLAEVVELQLEEKTH